MVRFDVKPELLRWARERAGLSVDALAKRFPKLREWEEERSRPTLKQLGEFAKATRAAVGFLFLEKPPVERLPIPDFRTIANSRLDHPSPDLLDTIYLCQQRQEWYREFARANGEESLAFVSSATAKDNVVTTAEKIRRALAFDVEERRALASWEAALARFCDLAEGAGVLVMRNGVVGNDTHRKLDAQEFRGFALSDDLAPLIFVNASDTKAAQMFTVAHELAHLWLGKTALSDATVADVPEESDERWCNRVAAELLVPLEWFRKEYRKHADLSGESQRLARIFKVSTLVVLRRMLDAGGLSRERFWAVFESELARLRAIAKSSGGDFYLTQGARLSKRFARALVASALGGETLFVHAMRMLGISKLDTFDQLGRSLGVAE